MARDLSICFASEVFSQMQANAGIGEAQVRKLLKVRCRSRMHLVINLHSESRWFEEWGEMR